MQRRLIRQGGGGYTVYLPKKWVDARGLADAGSVDVTETGSALVIQGPSAERKSITIALGEDNRKDILHLLTHLYRRGFDSITFTGADAAAAKEIKRLTNELLLGFSATRAGDTCVVENIAEPTDEKYDALLRRSFLAVKELLALTLADAQEKKFSHLDEAEELKMQQDKHIIFCRRLIVKQRAANSSELRWEMLGQLMHINHAIYYLYRYCAEQRPTLGKRTHALLKELQAYYDLYYDAFYKRSVRNIHRLHKLKAKYHFGECYEALAAARGKEAVVLSHVREAFRLIHISTGPILSELFEETLSQAA